VELEGQFGIYKTIFLQKLQHLLEFHLRQTEFCKTFTWRSDEQKKLKQKQSFSGTGFIQEIFYQQEVKLPCEICCMTRACSESENEVV